MSETVCLSVIHIHRVFSSLNLLSDFPVPFQGFPDGARSSFYDRDTAPFILLRRIPRSFRPS